MKRWRLLEKKRKHYYFVSYRAELAVNGNVANFVHGGCSLTRNNMFDGNIKGLSQDILEDLIQNDPEKEGYSIVITSINKL